MTREMGDFILLTFIIDLAGNTEYLLISPCHKQLLFQDKCNRGGSPPRPECNVRQHFT